MNEILSMYGVEPENAIIEMPSREQSYALYSSLVTNYIMKVVLYGDKFVGYPEIIRHIDDVLRALKTVENSLLRVNETDVKTFLALNEENVMCLNRLTCSFKDKTFLQALYQHLVDSHNNQFLCQQYRVPPHKITAFFADVFGVAVKYGADLNKQLYYESFGRLTMLDYVEATDLSPFKPDLHVVFDTLLDLGADVNGSGQKPLIFTIYKRIATLLRSLLEDDSNQNYLQTLKELYIHAAQGVPRLRKLQNYDGVHYNITYKFCNNGGFIDEDLFKCLSDGQCCSKFREKYKLESMSWPTSHIINLAMWRVENYQQIEKIGLNDSIVGNIMKSCNLELDCNAPGIVFNNTLARQWKTFIDITTEKVGQNRCFPRNV